MAEKILVVVDMQKDFVDGSLGTKEAQAIVPAVVKKVSAFDGEVVFTRDTHGPEYLNTQEGKNLPVEHCIQGTEGWKLIRELERIRLSRDLACYNKPTFGCTALAEDLKKRYDRAELESVELIGLCTDICVVSNALLLKAAMPELPIFVDPSCCAGVTPESHEAALTTMRFCQIQMV